MSDAALFGVTLGEGIVDKLGGWPTVISLIVAIVALVSAMKPKVPAPAPTPTPQPAPAPAPQASPLDLSRLEQGLMQVHAAATDAGNMQAIDPARIATLLQTLVQAWPLVVFFAGLLGIKLPPLPINPTPPQASRQ